MSTLEFSGGIPGEVYVPDDGWLESGDPWYFYTPSSITCAGAEEARLRRDFVLVGMVSVSFDAICDVSTDGGEMCLMLMNDSGDGFIALFRNEGGGGHIREYVAFSGTDITDSDFSPTGVTDGLHSFWLDYDVDSKGFVVKFDGVPVYAGTYGGSAANLKGGIQVYNLNNGSGREHIVSVTVAQGGSVIDAGLGFIDNIQLVGFIG